MNVLSLFDGMSCCQIALNKIGITPVKYYAAEVDKYAIKVTQANYPNTIQLGDVTKWREWDINWSSIDLLMGGSPCQGFSFAGKQLAFDDPRSALFFVYVDILKHIRLVNPRVKFMLENVKMKKEYLDVISRILEVEPVFINSNLVSAQNRQRFYWANWTIEQPEDKGIYLKDILETDGSGWLKSHGEYHPRNEKGMCIDANYHKGADNHGQRTLIKQYPRGKNQGGIRALDGKTPTLSANSWEQNNKLVTGYSYNLNDGLIKPLDKAYPLNASDWRGLNRNQTQTAVVDSVSYRKLTPIECERLQTVPDNYTNHVSNTQRYKMLGNGWTVDVVTHIFSQAEF